MANKANEICTNEKKKTISLEHLYKSIEFFKLGSQMEELKKVEQDVKNDVMVNSFLNSDETVNEDQDPEELRGND